MTAYQSIFWKQEVEVLKPSDSLMYLGKSACLTNIHDGELDNRIAKAWSKFQTNKTPLCDKKIDIGDRMRLFESVVTPTVLYGSACWTTNAARKRGLRTTQRKMARMMLGKLWIAPDQQNPPPKSINDENNSVSESSSSSSLSSNSSSSNDRCQ